MTARAAAAVASMPSSAVHVGFILLLLLPTSLPIKGVLDGPGSVIRVDRLEETHLAVGSSLMICLPALCQAASALSIQPQSEVEPHVAQKPRNCQPTVIWWFHTLDQRCSPLSENEPCAEQPS